MNLFKSLALVLGFLSINLFAMHHESSKEDIARGWVEAGYT